MSITAASSIRIWMFRDLAGWLRKIWPRSSCSKKKNDVDGGKWFISSKLAEDDGEIPGCEMVYQGCRNILMTVSLQAITISCSSSAFETTYLKNYYPVDSLALTSVMGKFQHIKVHSKLQNQYRGSSLQCPSDIASQQKKAKIRFSCQKCQRVS